MYKKNNLLEQSHIIIRSVGERTEDLCKYSIIQNGVSEDNISIIKNVSPFSEALKKGYELALKMNKKYTFFIDADMIPLENSLKIMLTTIDRLPENTFFINPLCYDYLTRYILPNGPHLYRTKYLKEAINLIPDEKISIRPETYTTKQMKKNGYELIYLDIPLSLHEFEQYHIDIFKRVINKYNKFPHSITVKLEKIYQQEKANSDYQTALRALEYAQKNQIKTKLDYKQFDNIFKKYNIKEKNKISTVSEKFKKLSKNIYNLKKDFIYIGYTHQILEKSKKKNHKKQKNIFYRAINKLSNFNKNLI